MKTLKIIILIVTLISGIGGVIISGADIKSEGKGELAAVHTQGDSVTEENSFSPTPVLTPAPPVTLMAGLTSQDDPTTGNPGKENEILELEIPEIVIADMNDEEDPETDKTSNSGSVTIQKEEQKPTPTPVPTVAPGNPGDITVTEPTATPIPEGPIKHYNVGIDVSKWNGDVDWAKVAASGVEFAIIRAGYRGSSSGKIVADPKFYQNIEGALSNGIEVGVYFYSQAITKQEAVQEAAWVCELIKNYNITYPVAYDLEEVTKGRIKNCSYEQFNINAVAFLEYVESKGYTGSLYSCKSYLGDVWQLSLYDNYHIWLAHYTSQTSYTGRYDMWQYTDKGKVNGISTSVDLNYSYYYETITPEPTATPLPTPEAGITATPEPTSGGEGVDITPVVTVTPEVSITPVDGNNQSGADGFALRDEWCVVTVSEDSLNVRETPSVEGNVIGTLNNRVEVHRIGVSDTGWSKIEYNGGSAYVSSEYLTNK